MQAAGRCVALSLVCFLALASGAAHAVLIVLNASDNYTDTLETGVTISQLGVGNGSNGPGTGPIVGTNLVFACGASGSASLTDVSAHLGGSSGASLSGCNDQPRTIIRDDVRFTGIAASGGRYDIQFLSWRFDSGVCRDRDMGTSCGLSGQATSYLRVLAVPEPRSSALLAGGLGVLGVLLARRRRAIATRRCRA
jgi:hypothetical protein